MGDEPAGVSDAYLVDRARDGYLDAYEMLVQRHSSGAYLLALRLLGDSESARDLTQESLVAAWRGLSRFRGDAEFRTWLYRIVTNTCLRHVERAPAKTSSLASLDETADPAPGPATAALNQAKVTSVQQAILALPAAQRVPLVLHEYQQLSYQEIAEVTDSSIAAVRSQLFRARRALKHTLEEWR